MKKKKLGKLLNDLTNPENNLGGRPKVFTDDICVVLPMSVPSKQKANLRTKWNEDLEEFKVKK